MKKFINLNQEERIKEIRQDYKNMQEMFFGEFPKFDEMIDFLKSLEKEYNKS